MTPIKGLIAASVREVIRAQYPEDYMSLCHAYAVVGANLASIALQRVYKPVAGLAAIDSGAGTLIYMADASAFKNEAGGAYHCWIESTDTAPEDKELVDFTFGHNRIYALKNELPWSGVAPPRYLWGPYRDVVLGGPLHELRAGFGKEKIWLQGSDEGTHWMADHLQANMNGYVQLTAAALKTYKKKFKGGAMRPLPSAHWFEVPEPSS
jgi:hypothetical protein